MRIEDSGPGIPLEHQAMLFQPLPRRNQALARRTIGSGLGLVICKRLVDILGGTIEIESEVGRGSCFTVCVPGQLEEQSGEHSSLPLPLANRSVLIIDPNETGRAILGQQLRHAGARIAGCADLASAHTLIDTAARELRPIEIVIVDEQTSGFGSEAIAALRTVADRADGIERAVLVLLGSAVLGQQAAAWQEASADAVLERPLPGTQLVAAILRAFDNHAHGRREQVGREMLIPRRGRLRHRLRHALHELHVLLVEDNPINLKVGRMILGKLGVQVHAATDGQQALDLLNAHHIDLVFMDCEMPGLDGYEATRQIRRRESRHGGHLPIIAMTAHAQPGDRERCIAAGMDDYLKKPISERNLTDMLEAWR
jgi:CheY-like chemotaxis protein